MSLEYNKTNSMYTSTFIKLIYFLLLQKFKTNPVSVNTHQLNSSIKIIIFFQFSVITI